MYVPELSYPTPKKNFAFENRSYLGEFEAEFIKALARESGAQGVLFGEKPQRSKISLHSPFKFWVLRCKNVYICSHGPQRNSYPVRGSFIFVEKRIFYILKSENAMLFDKTRAFDTK
jgi:hypothetical protein